jgi:hypothetical protein
MGNWFSLLPGRSEADLASHLSLSPGPQRITTSEWNLWKSLESYTFTYTATQSIEDNSFIVSTKLADARDLKLLKSGPS